MPERCKELFIKALTITPKELKELIVKEDKTDADNFLLEGKKKLKDFDIGLCVPGKLLPKRIRGGTVLTETTYKMR